jgi:general secretion pathway protein G
MNDPIPSSPPRPALRVLDYAPSQANVQSQQACSDAKFGLVLTAATMLLGLFSWGSPNPLVLLLLPLVAATLFMGTLTIVNSVRDQAYRHRLSLFLGIVELALAATTLLASLVVPMSRPRGCGDSRVSLCRSDITTFESRCERFNIDMDRHPTTAEGLAALVQAPTKDPQNWRGPYLKSIPKDPWGNPYIYVSPGQHNPGGADISSAGPDGKLGTEDDVNNWP